MDLGFARRVRAQKTVSSALDLATVLAQAAARQTMTPTAKAHSLANFGQETVMSVYPEVEAFAPVRGRKAICASLSSFNKESAGAIITLNKSL